MGKSIIFVRDVLQICFTQCWMRVSQMNRDFPCQFYFVNRVELTPLMGATFTLPSSIRILVHMEPHFPLLGIKTLVIFSFEGTK